MTFEEFTLNKYKDYKKIMGYSIHRTYLAFVQDECFNLAESWCKEQREEEVEKFKGLVRKYSHFDHGTKSEIVGLIEGYFTGLSQLTKEGGK